jgi:hypothetical protein
MAERGRQNGESSALSQLAEMQEGGGGCTAVGNYHTGRERGVVQGESKARMGPRAWSFEALQY